MRYRYTYDPAVWSLGIRIGYWPCVKSPFIQVNVGNHYLSVWCRRARWGLS